MSSHENRFPRRLSAVIFDLDDTLVISTVDYAKFKQQVVQRILEDGEAGFDYSPNELVVKIIARYETSLRSKGFEDRDIRQRLTVLDSIMDAVELEKVSETAAISGALELLAMLRAKGVKVGVLTRGCEEYARAALTRTGMAQLVDGIEGRNSKTKPKPNPESYLKLTEALGVNPEDTVFVGDHPMDAECARNAGAPFVGVMTGDIPEEELLRAGSIAVFRDVGQMFDWLGRLLADSNK